jgi:CheY-like chemotaxis protein
MPDTSILIVENEPDLAEIFAEILSYEGIETNVALDGEAALRWLEARVPDLLILDMHMPGLSGLDVLDAVRADPRLARLPVVAVTADVLLAREEGNRFDAAFIKPVQIEDLLQVCHQLIPS